MKTLVEVANWLDKEPLSVRYRATLFTEIDGKVVNETDVNVTSLETDQDFSEWPDVHSRVINYVPHPFVNITMRGYIVPPPAKPAGPSLNQKRAKRDWHSVDVTPDAEADEGF